MTANTHLTDDQLADMLERDDTPVAEPTWTHPALQALIDARNDRVRADDNLADAVARFRAETGASWDAVGQILGLTRQGAHARYNKHH